MEMKKVTFDGLEAIELINGTNKLVVTTSVGPRICFFGKEENILYWDKQGFIRDEYVLYGGHRVWLTRPFADESEDTYQPDNEPCEVVMLENGVRVTAPKNKNNISRGMEIRVLTEEQFSVENFITNEGPLIYSAGVWSPTCIIPDNTEMAIHLYKEDATWDLVKVVIPRVFAGNTIPLNDDQVRFTDKYLVVKPMGKTSKRCAYSSTGIITMNNYDFDLNFTKVIEPTRDGNYHNGGCNMAVFVGENNFMGEMETYSIEQSIYPNETLSNKEVWSLRKGVIPLS